QPTRYAHVQQLAGAVFEMRQQPEEAVEHFLAAGEAARAAHIMQAMARQLFIGGRRQTLRAWFEQLPIQYHALAPELLLSQGQALLETGQSVQATSILQQAEAGFQAQADRFGQIRAKLLQGWTYHARGKYSDGLQLAHELLPQLNAVQEPLLTAEALRLIGTNYYGRGDWTAAEQPLEQALAIYREAPADNRRTFSLGRTLEDLANVLRTTGRLEEAATLQAEALTLWRQIGNPGPLARCLNNLGYDRYVAGDYDGALALYTEALTRAEEAEDLYNRTYLMDGIAAAHRDRGDSAQALNHYRRALDLANELGDQAIVSWLLNGLGHVYRLTDDLERALSLFEQARSLAERAGIHAYANHALASMGIARVEQGQIAAGLTDLNRAVDALRQSDSYLDLGKMLLWQARAHYLDHDEPAAKHCLTEMVRLGHRLGCRPFALAEGRRAAALLSWGAEQFDDRLLNQWASTVQVVSAIAPPVMTSAAAPPHIEVRALGSGQVWRDERVLASAEWGGSALARELFFFLLERSPQRRDEIGAIFWPSLSPGRMTSSFHAAKYKARRALGIEFAVFEDDCYQINPAMNVWYDVAEFRRLLASARGRSVDDPDRVAEFQQALDLYAGPYLMDSYAEWPTQPRDGLQVQFFELVKTLVDDLFARRQYSEALAAAQRGLEQDYYREDLHQVVMRCLVEIGQSARALAHYDKMSRRLMKDLGARPNPNIRALAKQIRATQSVSPQSSSSPTH
ncbi:MAG: tetratricopeptide repeat protein, partial [Chloroflexi bacterium]|nr:tetratricopeptide repeat protein [Chloroflexota bacterium]